MPLCFDEHAGPLLVSPFCDQRKGSSALNGIAPSRIATDIVKNWRIMILKHYLRWSFLVIIKKYHFAIWRVRLYVWFGMDTMKKRSV